MQAELQTAFAQDQGLKIISGLTNCDRD